MPSPKVYAAAGAFRRALEDRLKRIAHDEKVDVNRLRRQVAFDRLLARLFLPDLPTWVLKGGYALELLFDTAHATIDIDLTIPGVDAAGGQPNEVIRQMLQEAAGASLDDWFEFAIAAPIMDLDAAPYGGARFPVEAKMDARIFARFHLDIGVGDFVLQPVDLVECRDWLAFAGIARPSVRIIPREQQFAEKLHAYTLPRSTPNSRVKDLVDLALLVRAGELKPSMVSLAVDATFGRRGTHDVPRQLDPPPTEWFSQFAELSESCLDGATMTDAFEGVRTFLNDLQAAEREASLDRLSRQALDLGLYDRNGRLDGDSE
ncbi:MAG TPA: nucleotidyl transferase AbiEii/AbiGii toxin family protein [Bryobacteraceae bacterium]|nr:nucleotidyl transferase AbiEii/AbiGii toxin family protein [Bryobacteraceae bacterium]